MKKLVFIIGLIVGYVLGARAGRRRYDQIAEKAKNVWESTSVQHQVGKAEESLKTVAGMAGDAALDGVKNLTNRVIDSKKSLREPSAK
ncbi:hypothetical protein GCM10011490_18630 [Pseudoclavibacter endophyticus]|uniref:YtxH domain-containing protein n=1 Tax=Pseudoclavibacter endophyticus TaxID=1778590 RepID=A0A6H9WP48_9MICO|nr:hypothetical protein [Pseudoclavibacter endophyticus]KAB1648797.1 hypothetical protein F8O04_00365 [Pseudoclavibacter endophyticus]GGA68448.1 hypothetical protein GCM10011490_18630 [Pseudoclavibacter endophyticus]